MTLKNLIEKYSGTISVDVVRAIDGGVEDVITFSIEDSGAIKEAIINSDVDKYSIEVSQTRVPTMKVVLAAATS